MMEGSARPKFVNTAGRVAGGFVLAIAILVAVRWVDLTPQVEADFFFSPDDPQYVASASIADRFPTGSQIIIRAAGTDIRSRAYRERVGTIASTVAALPGVTSVNSVANQDAFGSPLWRRVLVSPDSQATNLLVQLTGSLDPAAFIPVLEATVGLHATDDLDLRISGVPYVVEKIRRNLYRDLSVFSVAAVVVFGALVALIYRSAWIVLGTLSCCATASIATLAITQLAGGHIGLLTANIATIVFVLTLSHIVFITSNYRQCLRAPPTAGSVMGAAVRLTLPASFWCMTTTMLGFLSLFLASAKPLRELGTAGAIGTITALCVAYVMFPPFLAGLQRDDAAWFGAPTPLGTRARALVVSGFAAAVVILGTGVARIDTDPELLSYFAADDPLRSGLEAIDRDGGSSPLSVIIRAPQGRLDERDAVARLNALQARLEADPAVGSAVTPALIFAEIRNLPLMGTLPLPALLTFIQQLPAGRILRSYVTEDRDEGLVFLRMREAGRTETRDAILDRIDATVREQGFTPVLMGGLYEQQSALGHLLASSLRIGLGGLIVLFLGIAFAVSRDGRATAAMVACLAGIPALVLGTMGHVGMPIDIITSPAANVALAMGVDSMIHMLMRARRLRRSGASRHDAWWTAQRALYAPILGAALIVSAGFGIFSLSTFPPTQRFGVAVILGTVTAAVTAVFVLPALVGGRERAGG